MSTNLSVWIVDDDQSMRWVLGQALSQANMQTRSFADAESVLAALKDASPDVLITDVRMPGKDGLSLLADVARMHPKMPVIVMTAHSDLGSAVKAYRGGAYEYLPKPFDVDDAVALVERAASEHSSEELEKAVPKAMGVDAMLGQAPAMQEVFRAIGRLSNASLTVLITGESGTGKELIARALHQHSPRSSTAFVALNMSAIPAELLESELFGHERGAFTGADTRRVGRFEQANGGTLFLDEIGDMSLALQTRLLRVLSEGEFYRVGGQQAIAADVRVIAATNRNLEADVASGTFREDLFHRLNVIRIESPPLRKRKEDIELLLKHYLDLAATELGVEAKSLSSATLRRLRQFDWPGNVRQLVNVCRRLTVTAPGVRVDTEDLPPEFLAEADKQGSDWHLALKAWAEQTLNESKEPALAVTAVAELEKMLIQAALAHAGGHRQKAAKLLGWGRNTLTRKIKALGLDSDTKPS
ncbi:MAG: nitrogen regulation protein NR(I) [Pseudomonadota bacterium]